MTYPPRHYAASLIIGLTAILFQPPEAESQGASLETLQQQIKQRDATISELMRRVEALEQKLGGAGALGTVSTASGEPGKAAPTDTGEEEASRALERTLVRERAVVLPAWSVEIEPSYTYTYRDTENVRLANPGGQPLLVQRDLKRNTSNLGMELRLGLPWTSQVDFTAPYRFLQEESATGGSTKRRRSGWGDLQLGLTKQLFLERGWMPDLLTSVVWDSKTGNHDLGSDFNEIAAGLTAVKRRDPLAFFGSVSHTWSLSGRQSGNDVDQGNSIGVRFGTILATSPDTSLRFGFQVSRSGKVEVNRRKQQGSEMTVALFEIGAATIVLPRTLLDVTAGIGLTDDSPDFRFGVSLPFRAR